MCVSGVKVVAPQSSGCLLNLLSSASTASLSRLPARSAAILIAWTRL